ncbi:MAG TPA: hypothetical protein VKU38_16210, partial [Ktedonobacteraceae bacterium]|nr:hypothetical protein [Ktedonobacteraceae bacterium]
MKFAQPIIFLISSHTIILSKNMSSIVHPVFEKSKIDGHADMQSRKITARKQFATHTTQYVCRKAISRLSQYRKMGY